jgi:hypothetical protein
MRDEGGEDGKKLTRRLAGDLAGILDGVAVKRRGAHRLLRCRKKASLNKNRSSRDVFDS